MNFRKLSLSIAAFFCGALFFTATTNAITLQAYSMAKVKISIIQNDDPNIVKGKIWGESKALQKAKKAIFQVIDKNKAVVVEQENPAKFSEKKPEQLDIDFELNLTDYKLSGEYLLRANIFNEDGRRIAFGEITKKFAGNSEIKNSIISDLKIKVDKDLVKGSVQFENNGKAGDFVAKIDLYKDNNEKEYVGTFSSEIISMKAGEKLGIPFVFTKPVDPQLYNVKVGIVQNNEAVTGKLMGNFFVKGDFGEFYSLEINPAKYLKKGDSVTIKFTGGTTTDMETPLSVEINVKNEGGMALQKFVNVQPENVLKNFSGQEMFLITEETGKLSIEAILWKDNKELGRISKTTREFAKPKEFGFINKIKDLKSRENLSTTDKYKIIAILVLIVLAIVIFIRGLVRANKGKEFFIFFCLILSSGTVFATDINTYFPEHESAYNLDETSAFNKLGFWGVINTTGDGILPDVGESVNYKVTLTGGDTPIELPGTYASIGKKEYKFIINIPNNTQQGKYEVNIELSPIEGGGAVNFDMNDLDTNTPLTIYIDGTKPDQTYATSGLTGSVFTNSTFQLEPQCENDLSGCYTDFAGFDVTGNFCDSTSYGTICKDDSGAERVHKFKICDIAGNCNTESAKINFYDPVKPTMGAGGVTNDGGILSIIAAGFIESLTINGLEDPASDVGVYTVDSYVCEHSNDFVLDADVCIEREIACAVSAWGHGVKTWNADSSNYSECSFVCPDGLELDSAGECKPTCYTDKFPYCFAVEPEA